MKCEFCDNRAKYWLYMVFPNLSKKQVNVCEEHEKIIGDNNLRILGHWEINDNKEEYIEGDVLLDWINLNKVR